MTAKPDMVKISLLPWGKEIEVPRGTPLQDALFPQGVEFPCGGRCVCRGCKVRLIKGSIRITREQEHALKPALLDEGWRLACCAMAEEDLILELGQSRAMILLDDSIVDCEPRDGLGVAVDVGSATLAAQLIDLSSGTILGTKAALNPQAGFGADIMTRIEHALKPEGRRQLRDLVRDEIGEMVQGLLNETDRSIPVERVVLVGNTVMHHLFLGLDVEPLARLPFEPREEGEIELDPNALGWSLEGNPPVSFLSWIGGFVGSDILAGVLATKLHEVDELTGFVDLGTNGEILISDGERILCASTAAGPAFEGGQISSGMRASTGAISRVWIQDGEVRTHILGRGRARGICGSGLVDAVAVALELGLVEPSGKLTSKTPMTLAGPVSVTQHDIRELQLAKGAVAAGVSLLLRRFGVDSRSLSKLHLCGGFGNTVDAVSARRIGLFDLPREKIEPAGNTALRGAKMALLSCERGRAEISHIRNLMEHVSLAEDPGFQDAFLAGMPFPNYTALR